MGGIGCRCEGSHTASPALPGPSCRRLSSLLQISCLEIGGWEAKSVADELLWVEQTRLDMEQGAWWEPTAPSHQLPLTEYVPGADSVLSASLWTSRQS